jgi:hypothetical protein
MDVGRGDRLAGMRPHGVQLRLERPVRAEHGLDRERGGQVGDREQVAGVLDRQQHHAEHPVGAIDKRQPFLRGQGDGAQPRPGQRLRPGDPRAVLVEHPALAEQHHRAVGERCEVAGGAERAMLRNPGRDVVVEQVDERLGHERADARPAERQRAHPQQHHRPHDLTRHRRAHAGRVRADQSVLQLGPPRGVDERAGQRAESRGHAVDRPAGAFDLVDDLTARGHRLDDGWRQRDARSAARDREHVVRGDSGGLDGDDRTHGSTPLCMTVWTKGTPGR